MGLITKTVYLCGTMSHLKGYGRSWRKRLGKWCADRGVRVYNPCEEETKEHTKYDMKKIPAHKWESYPQLLQEEILKKDLDQIRLNTNYIICYFTQYSTGTVSELTFAYYYNIPIYMVTNRRLIGWPATVMGADGNKVFRTFTQLQNFLKVKYRLKRVRNA